jgi:subtilase family serine protease
MIWRFDSIRSLMAPGSVRRRKGQKAGAASADAPNRSKAPPFRRRPLFEALEARLLMSADTVQIIQGGTQVDGNITAAGETDRYSFTLTEAKQLYFDALTDTPFNWSLEGPAGAVVTARSFQSSDAQDFSNSPVLNLTAGDYLLSVDANVDATGAYGFRLLDLGQAGTLTPNITVSGQLDPGRETDAYRFSVQAGERFFFDMHSVSNTNAQWRLVDPFGDQVFATNIGTDIEPPVLTKPGTYTLLLEGRRTQTTPISYQFNVQKVVDENAALTLGALVNGSIAHAGQQDFYTFALSQRSRVYLDSLTNTAIHWTLTGPGGVIVDSRGLNATDSSTIGSNPVLDLVAGSYTLRFDAGGDATGDYAFRMLDLSAAPTLVPQPGGSTPITATLNPGSRTLHYGIDAAAGDRLFFDRQSQSGGTVTWRLIDPYGGQVFSSNFSTDVGNVTLTAAGRYTLLIEGHPSNAVPIDVVFNVEPRGNLNGELTTAFADEFNGTLSSNWRLETPRDGLTYLGTPTYRLEALDGVQVLRLDNDLNNNQRVGFGSTSVIPSAANFRYELRFNTLTQSFSTGVEGLLEFWLVDEADPSRLIAAAVTGGPSGTDRRLFSNAPQGGGFVNQALPFTDNTWYRAVIEGSPTQAMKVSILSDAGTELVSRTFTVGTDLFANGFRVGFGQSTSSPNRLAPMDVAIDYARVTATPIATTPLVFDTLTTGTRTVANQRDVYTFSVAADTIVYFDNRTDTGAINWTLKGPAGTVVANRNLNGSDAQDGRPFYRLVAGSYTLTFAGTGTGNYTFKLGNVASGTPITLGTPVSGTLSPGNETDIYRFAATAGENLYVDMQTVQNGDGWWRLLDPNGDEVWSATLGTDSGVLAMPHTGIYTLMLDGRRYYTADNAYRFNVSRVVDTTRTLVPGESQGLGPYWSSGPIGSALEFADLDYVEVPHGSATNLTGSMTLEARFRVDSFQSTWTPILYKGLNGLGGNDYLQRTYALYVNADGRLSFGTGSQGVETTAGTVQVGQWIHVAGVIDRATGQVRLYVNGQQVGASAVQTAPANSYANPLQIGRAFEGYDDQAGLFGAIDEVRLWSRARTQVEIDAARNRALDATELADGNLALYLPFNEGTGRTTTDPRAGGSVGTLRNVGEPLGDVVQGRLTSAGNRDIYNFTLTDAKQLYLDSLTNNNFTWTLTGPRGTVVNSREFRFSNGGDIGNNPVMNLVAGDYTLTVDAPGDVIGPYAFRLRDLATAATIDPGVPVVAELRPGKETDFYRFDAQAGARFYFDLQAVANGDAQWRLINPFGDQVFSGSLGSDIDTFALAQTGTYTLLVEGRRYNIEPNAYRFTIEKVVDSVTPITVGQTLNLGPYRAPGSIGNGLEFGEMDYVEVPHGTATDLTGSMTVEFSFRVDRFLDTWTPLVYKGMQNEAVGNDWQQRTYAVWVNADGRLVLSSAGQEVITLTGTIQAGAWYHVAGVIDRASGQMRLILNGEQVATAAARSTPASSYATPLTIGRALTGWDDNVGLFGAIDEVRLWNRARTIDEIRADRNTSLTGTESGLTLYLPFSETSGLTTTGSVGPAGTLRNLGDTTPGVVQGRITQPGARSLYTFALAQDSKIYFDALSDVEVNWTLTGPRGTVVSARSFRFSNSGDFGSNPVLDLVAGQYTLTVDAGSDFTAPFAFRLVDLLDAAPILPDVEVTGTLFPGNETQFYRFDAAAGARFYFDSLSVSNTDAQWRLIDRYGDVVWSTTLGTDVDVTTLRHSGTYTLILEGRRYNTEPNAYRFSVRTVTDDTVAIVSGQSHGIAPEWGAGNLGSGLHLSGTEYLEAAHGAGTNLTGDLTFEAWIKVDRFANTWMPIVTKEEGTGFNRRAYSMWVRDNGAVWFGTSDSVGNQNVETVGGLVAAGQWVHVAGVIDRSGSAGASPQIRVFVNGVAAGNGTASVRGGPALSFSTPLSIGRTIENSTSYALFEGSIDDIRLWSIARTEAQIQATKDAPLIGAEPGLALYLPLDQAAGRTVTNAVVGSAAVAWRSYDDTASGAVVGNIAVPGQRDTYTFTVSAAQRLYLDSLYETDFTWTLTGPRGTVIENRQLRLSNSSDLGGTNGVLDLVPGEYRLTIDAAGAAIGRYGFRLLDLATATPITPGTPFGGTLDPGSSTDLYRFEGTAGQRLYFDLQTLQVNDGVWRLIDPFGDQLVYTGFGSDVDVTTLANTGTYTLLFEGRRYNLAPNAYTFNVQPVTDLTQALAIGAITSSTIDITGRRDVYSFSLTERRSLLMDALGGANFNWTLRGPLGDVVTSRALRSSDANGVGSAPVLDLIAGDYTLVVDPAGDATGSYTFRLLDLATATSIAQQPAAGSSVAGTLTPGNATRMYAFDAAAGDRVFFDQRTLTGGSAYWRLVDPAGRQVFFSGFSDVAERTLTVTGRYTLLIEGTIDQTGDVAFGFNVEARGNTPPPAITPNDVAFATLVQSSIAAAGEVDTYTFTLTEAKRIVFDSRTDAFSLLWGLEGPRGMVVDNVRFYSSDSARFGSANPVLLLEAGSYVLRVRGESNVTGAYAFQLLDLASATAVTSGQVVDGTLNPGSETDLYRIEGVAGERWYFDMQQIATLNMAWRLIGPLGQQVAYSDQGSLQALDLDVTLLQTGSYVLLVEGQPFNSAANNYRFVAQRVADVTSALTLGATVNASIGQPGERDSYTFTLADRKQVVFDVLSDIGFTWTLTGPRGVVVNARSMQSTDAQDFGSNPVLDLVAGAYTLVIDAAADAVGAYSFRMLDLAAAEAITPGTPRSATLSPGTGTALFRFEGVVGERYYFDMQSFASGNGTWRLIGPYGDYLLNGGFGADSDVTTLVSTGTHVLLFEGRRNNGPASSIAFTFNVQKVVDDTPALVLGQTQNGAIAHAGQRDLYTFTLADRKQIVFDALSDTSFSWTLTGPRGTIVNNRSLQSSDAQDFSGSPVLDLVAGDYVLAVDVSAETTGPYSFRLLDLAAATPITPGSPVAGQQLVPGNETRMYRFDAQAGDRYYFDAQATSNTNGRWRLLSSYGDQVFEQALGTDAEIFTLANAGTYTLLFEGRRNNAATPITFAFAVTPAPLRAPLALDGLQGQPGPDLVATDVQVLGTLESGQILTVRWLDRNAGNLDAGVSWRDRVIVRNTTTNEVIANVLLPVAIGGAQTPLAPGQSLQREVNFALPDGARGAGNLSVTVTVDVDNALAEQNATQTAESNNETSVAVTSVLATYADLVAGGLQVNPPTAWAAGASVTLSWHVDNAGTRAVDVAFVDAIQVRNLTTGAVVYSTNVTYDPAAPGNGPIAPGSGRDRQHTFIWPASGAQGLFEFQVITDSGNAVFEVNGTGTGETNNATALTIASAPDLVVENLRLDPGAVESGALLVLRWDDVNLGALPVAANWRDRIEVLNTRTGETLLVSDLLHDSAPGVDGVLGAGERHARAFSFRVPDGARGAGLLRITVTADRTAGNATAILEANTTGNAEVNNAAALEVTSAERAYPDLRAYGLSAPSNARGGDMLLVNWSVANDGSVDAVGDWIDRIVLSQDAIFGNADDQVLGTRTRTGGLAAGAFYDASLSVTIPTQLEGGFNLFLRTDATNVVVEPDTRANNDTGPRAVSLSTPFADLAVEAVAGPPTAPSGSRQDVTWRVRNIGDTAIAGTATWKDRVYLSLDGVLDAGDVLLGDAVRNGPLAVGEAYTGRTTITLPNAISGEYRFIVVSDVEAQVFERGLEANNTGAALLATAVSVAPSPDLAVSDINVPSTALTGTAVPITWKVTNVGEAAATGAWVDRIYLSPDGTLNGASLLATVNRPAPPAGPESLAAGAFYTGSADVGLPLIADGAFRIVVVTDAVGQVYETLREANNQDASATTLAVVHNDLEVTQVTVPPAATSAGVLDVSWQVRNGGSADINQAWVDRVYLSRDQQWDANDRLLTERAGPGSLEVNASYGGNVTVTLPVDASGDWFVLVRTDAGGAVTEYNAENDNVGTAPVTVTLAPYADLQVSNVTAPALTIQDPARVTIGWTVTNVGTGIGITDRWVDRIVASRDGIAGNGDDITLAEFERVGFLAVGDQYSRSENLILAPRFSGRYTLFVVSDAAGSVFENALEANNASAAPQPFDVMPAPYADLQFVTASVDPAAESGGSFNVSWRVENRGIARTDQVKWADSVFITSDRDGRNVVSGAAGYFDHLGALSPGFGYDRTGQVTVEEGLTGTFHVWVRTGGPFEFIYDQDNTAYAGAIVISLAASPNLQVTDIVAPTESLEGELVEISWTVRNTGQARAEGPWTDSVVMRKLGGDTTVPPVSLGTFTYAQGLDVNTFYTRTERVRLPARLEGAWRVEVTTNSGRSLYEHAAASTDNTTQDDTALLLSLKPRADLQVESLTGPDRVSAGGTVSVEFDVVNRGSVDANGQWFDAVYLSLDNKLGGDDILIGRLRNGSALPAVDGRYSQVSDTLTIPLTFSGSGYLIAVADIDNVIDEYPRDDNNFLTRAITVDPLPPPDLVMSHVVAPDQGVYSGEIEVRYRVTNNGSGITDRETWSDTIWLARDKTRPTPGGNGGILLGTFTHTGRLEVGEFYERTVKVRLPSVIESGIYYITPWTDAFNAVVETNFPQNVNPDDPSTLDSSNFKARRIDVIGSPTPALPDLIPLDVTADPIGSVDGPFSVRWTVKNNGEGNAPGDWVDYVYVHDQPDLFTPGSKSWLLGTVGRPQGLASGESYVSSLSVELAPAVKGRYVTVLVDANPIMPFIVETIETNNSMTTTTSIDTRISDLRLASVEVPAGGLSGEPIEVRWTVVNDGGAVWKGTKSWQDVIYVSPDPVFRPERAIQIGSKSHDNKNGFAAGASYTESLEVRLPRGIEGQYYIYVMTDDQATPSLDVNQGDNARTRGFYSSRVYEEAFDALNPRSLNNRSVAGIPVIYREPDLVVSTLVTPIDPVNSGELINIQFTVTNEGNRATRENYWIDRVYLSRDPSLDSRDLELGTFIRRGGLAEQASYTWNLQSRLPDGASGQWYIIAYTDSDVYGATPAGSAAAAELSTVGLVGDNVPEFRGEGNNITSKAIDIVLRPAPNLQVTRVEPVERMFAGQFLDYSYTVTNTGAGGTPPEQHTWEDRIYLSADNVLDVNADRYIDTVRRTGGLAAGAHYDVTRSVRLTSDIVGAYYVFVLTDPIQPGTQPRGFVYEGANESDNQRPSPQPVLIELPPPSDLVVDRIAVPVTGVVNGPVTIEYDVLNDGANPAQGSWSDAIYVSSDATWDLGDRLLGRVSHSGGLAVGATYTGTLTATLPPLKEGQYRIIVRPDIFNEVYEGVDERNNARASNDTLAVTVPELPLGVTLDTTLSANESRLYKVTIGANETLRVSLDALNEDSSNEIYLRYGDVPSSAEFDATYENPLQADQIARIPSTQAGDYYVLVRGNSISGSNVPIKLKAESLPFQITDVYQDQGGDSRWVTMTIEGARFSPDALVKLVRPGLNEIEPVRYQVLNATKIIAIFDFRDQERGLYDVKVINPGGAEAIVAYRYLIERALPIDATIGLGGPRVVSAGDTGLYGVSLQSLTNVDTPYVYFEFGASEMLENQYVYNLPYVNFNSNVGGRPDGLRDDVPWSDLDSEINTRGWSITSGYALDLANGGFAGASFTVQTAIRKACAGRWPMHDPNGSRTARSRRASLR